MDKDSFREITQTLVREATEKIAEFLGSQYNEAGIMLLDYMVIHLCQDPEDGKTAFLVGGTLDPDDEHSEFAERIFNRVFMENDAMREVAIDQLARYVLAVKMKETMDDVSEEVKSALEKVFGEGSHKNPNDIH